MTDVFVVMNVVGLLAFAVVGASKAIESDLDIFGVAVLGVVTALGGGTTRDLLVNRTPLSLQSPTDVTVALLGVALAVGCARVFGTPTDHPFVRVADAVGLAAFAATGALVGEHANVSAYGIVVLATTTAVGGGAIADLLRGAVPFVLYEDFYATCALLGSAGFVAAAELGLSAGTAATVCAAIALASRLVAVRHGWELPTTAPAGS